MEFLRKFSIKTQLIINAFLSALLVILIFLFAYYRISDILLTKNKKYTAEITSNIQYNIKMYYNEINTILHNIGYNTNVQDYVLSRDKSLIYGKITKLNELTMNMVNMKKDIYDVAIIGNNGNYFTMQGKYDIAKNMKNIPKDGGVHNTGFVNINGSGSVSSEFFLYGMYFYSAYDNEAYGKRIGFASLLVDLNYIYDEINMISRNTEIKYYLVDKKGKLYSPNDPLNINNNKGVLNKIMGELRRSDYKQETIDINGNKNLVVVNDIPEIEGKIISFVPQRELFSEITQVRKIITIIFVIAVTLLSFLFFLTINNITRPIKNLIFFVKGMKSGTMQKLKTSVQLHGSSEIRVLSDEFNSMLNEIDSLTHRLLDTNSKLFETKLEKEKAELAFLKSQINPHFLYNTLEVMKGISLEEGTEVMYQMTKALALVFRYSINGPNDVMLSEEIKIAKAYIQIHTIRFGDRIEAHYDFSEECMNIKVFKMILQPIIENAMFYGLEPKRGKGNIWIGSKIEDGKLVIRIRDDGVGIPQDKLIQIQNGLSNVSENNGHAKGDNGAVRSNIGLNNINKRLKYAFGDEYGIDISSEENYGTEVTITTAVGEKRMYKAFIVDDEEFVIKSLIRAGNWSEYGFEVVSTANDGLDAYDAIIEIRPDIVFTDIRMPGMNGLEIIKNIHKVYSDVLCVVISGYAEFAYAQKAINYGAIGFCLKPFDDEDINSVLKKARSMLDNSNNKGHFELVQLLDELSPENEAKINSYIKTKISEISEKNAGRVNISVKNNNLRKIIEYININFTKEISIQSLSQEFSINQNYISQLFRKELGLTFTDYVTKLRIDFSMQLLQNNEYSLSDVAGKCGYIDYFYFIRVFKKIVGITPGQFRDRNQNAEL